MSTTSKRYLDNILVKIHSIKWIIANKRCKDRAKNWLKWYKVQFYNIKCIIKLISGSLKKWNGELATVLKTSAQYFYGLICSMLFYRCYYVYIYVFECRNCQKRFNGFQHFFKSFFFLMKCLNQYQSFWVVWALDCRFVWCEMNYHMVYTLSTLLRI